MVLVYLFATSMCEVQEADKARDQGACALALQLSASAHLLASKVCDMRLQAAKFVLPTASLFLGKNKAGTTVLLLVLRPRFPQVKQGFIVAEATEVPALEPPRRPTVRDIVHDEQGHATFKRLGKRKVCSPRPYA
jgi:hypothetical protein